MYKSLYKINRRTCKSSWAQFCQENCERNVETVQFLFTSLNIGTISGVWLIPTVQEEAVLLRLPNLLTDTPVISPVVVVIPVKVAMSPNKYSLLSLKLSLYPGRPILTDALQ